MNAIELLLTRQSDSQLSYPAPSQSQLEVIQQAALIVPDHAHLAPWQFIVLQDEERDKLGEVFYQAAVAENMEERTIDRAKSLTQRAPMIIVAIMRYKPHDKVPRVEQLASSACTVMAMQQAAFAQGLAGVWRTGAFAQSETVKNALKLTQDDEIMGFLYLGTATIDCTKRRHHQVGDFFSHTL